MSAKVLFDEFELVTTAPNGVAKLREMILDLAVRGLLVEQNEREEPAAILLDKIKAEKQRLANGKAKLFDDFASTDEADAPFAIPENWVWTRLDDISTNVHYGYTASADNSIKDVRLLRITDIQNGKVNWQSVPGCVIKEKEIENYELKDNDLLIARTGGTIGKSFLVKDVSVRAVFASYLIRVVPSSKISPEFAKLFLESSLYWRQLYAKSMGTGQPNVNGTSLRSLIFPLPPFDEQKRIVAKVDELMRLCDRLEVELAERERIGSAWRGSALQQLTAAENPAEFANCFRALIDNFELLANNANHVQPIRQAVLQLAVRGRLVPQSDKDEPAARLLERIKAEKQRLSNGKAKLFDDSTDIADNETPFELPKNWIWTRLKDIGFINPRNDIDDDLEVSFVPMTLMPKVYGEKVLSEVRQWKDVKKGFTHFAERDVALAKITPCFQNGKSAVMQNLRNNFGAGTTELLIFRPIEQTVLPEYVLAYLKSPLYISEGVSRMTGTAGQQRVSNDYFANNPFPLPPLEEQKQIVEKVEQIFGLCDRLEAELKQRNEHSQICLRALVAEVFSNN